MIFQDLAQAFIPEYQAAWLQEVDIDVTGYPLDGPVPLLQERGIFRREHVGDTLRDHLGIMAPDNRYTASR